MDHEEPSDLLEVRMKKLIALAQSRANNTGRTQYVCTRQFYRSDKRAMSESRVLQHPRVDYSRWLVLAIVTPEPKVRIALRKRRKTRGGNRVRVGNNVR
jgi:hypothetical protein